MKNDKDYRFDTRVIHAGQEPDPSTGAIITPIYATSTYVQSSPGKHQGYDYSRSGNPTRQALEDCMASLEQGVRGYAFASGMAAEASILELVDSGSHIIAADDLYGGSYRLMENVRKNSAGLEFSFVDFSDLSNVEAAIRPNTKMIWVETPTNPLLKLCDLAQLAELAQRHHIISVCDNTFCSPYLQQPLLQGIDIVCHSATKYLSGHSDVIGGIAVVSKTTTFEHLAERLLYLQNAIGAVMGPFDAFLVLRSLKTLSVRMEKHCKNAEQIVQWLLQHPKVEHVYYPGLTQHKDYAVAQKQMRLGGGMISVVLKGGENVAKTVLQKTSLFALAESLGGVESLIEHPAIMTHASIPAEIRETIGISAGLVRLSVGIEDVDDLIADLDIALS